MILWRRVMSVTSRTRNNAVTKIAQLPFFFRHEIFKSRHKHVLPILLDHQIQVHVLPLQIWLLSRLASRRRREFLVSSLKLLPDKENHETTQPGDYSEQQLVDCGYEKNGASLFFLLDFSYMFLSDFSYISLISYS